MGQQFHLSFEFYPPNSQRGENNLMRSATRLNGEQPDFFSVTYGAGGSTRTGTKQTVESLLKENWPAVPHLSWGHTTRKHVVQQIQEYCDLGVKALVLLRGDAPSGTVPGITHHASELVELVRSEFNDQFEIFVAAYPETHPDAPNPSRDIQYLRQKVDAGANACFTQYFYNSDAYFFFVDQCRRQGVDAPIIPGIMPITNYDRLVRFSRNCGAEIPQWIERKLFEFKEDQQALEDFGCEVVLALCQRLCDNGCPGLHFYTLNRARATQRILKDLAVS
ncbi:MAG: methylenetetrahydrofolate reductase [NAD(P)H] [Gammaproteobacteria bacterium]|nr:methylenetetrahydrofolate reductase [NAD(P)H] [Gammaproteobacteria bacterium]